MTITTVTPSEAEFEARIHSTLQRVFPGSTELRHQLRFKIRVGRTEMDAGANGYVEGRADIIVFKNTEPLAVLELKREHLPLTLDDQAQGASYALLCRAPLVVVTNGSDTRIFQTHDMTLIAGTSIEAAELASRVSTAASAAQRGVNGAISKLLGTDLANQAIRAVTSTELADLTGSWISSQRFVADFIVPRGVTQQVRGALRAALKRALIVSGPPLCGKSSVLRELAETAPTDGMDVLFIDASSCSDGLFRRLANVLTAQFSWPAGPDDARLWLRQIGNRANRRLVLCLDSLPERSPVLMGEIDEILSGSAGERIQLVLALDENTVDSFTKRNGREMTRLGRHSEHFEVGIYDDQEFASATSLLWNLGGGFVKGAEYAPELRSPWVMRAAVARQMEELPPGSAAVLPPLLGAEMFEVAQSRFEELGAIRDELSTLARTYLDKLYAKRHYSDALASLYVYSIGRDVVKKHLDRTAVNELLNEGLIRAGQAHSGAPNYVMRVPELFGHELVGRIAALLPRMVSKDADSAAKWLVKICARIPLGDAIGAAAVNRALNELGAPNYIHLINALLKLPPRREVMAPGSKMVGIVPEIGLLNFEVSTDGKVLVSPAGSNRPPVAIDFEDEDLTAVADIDGWLILSHLRQFNLAFADKDGNLLNISAWLLRELGACPVVLRRPGRELEGFHVHAIEGGELSCFKNGIAEPVTWAIAEMLTQTVPGVDRDQWVRDTVASGSLPLINRVGQALSHMSNVAGPNEWAKRLFADVYQPAISTHPQFH